MRVVIRLCCINRILEWAGEARAELARPISRRGWFYTVLLLVLRGWRQEGGLQKQSQVSRGQAVLLKERVEGISCLGSWALKKKWNWGGSAGSQEQGTRGC